MNRRLLLGAGGVAAAVMIAAGTASAASTPAAGISRTLPEQAATATATATARPGGPPSNPGNGNRPEATGQGARPENPGQGNRPENAGPDDRPAGSVTAGTGPSSDRPQLPPQASPRAKAAVEAAAKKHDLLRERLAAIKAIPKDADRAEAMKVVMADFGDLFHLVSDAVHSVDAKGTPTVTGTATGTATPTATPTSTATATATSTAQP